MLDLKINPRFAQYFGALDYGQERQLEKSLRDDLTSEPVLWWHNPEKNQDEILDGHNRYAIAKKHKLEIQFHEKHFESEDEAMLFVIRNQTTRRNIDNREAVVREAVELEIRLGKKKTQAVQDVAAEMGIAESTAWEAVKPVSASQQFFADKKAFERDLERVRNKEAEKLKQRASKEGWADDPDKLESEWQPIEDEIQKQFAEQSEQLKAVSAEIQTAQEAEGGRVSLGGPRKAKKSAAANSALRTIKSCLSKIEGLSYHFPKDFVPIDFKVCNQWIKDREPKKKFGR